MSMFGGQTFGCCRLLSAVGKHSVGRRAAISRYARAATDMSITLGGEFGSFHVLLCAGSEV